MKAPALIAAIVAAAVIGISSFQIASAQANGQSTFVCYSASTSETVNATTTRGNGLSCRTLAAVMMDPSTGEIRKPQHARNATAAQVDYAWNSLLKQELLAGH